MLDKPDMGPKPELGIKRSSPASKSAHQRKCLTVEGDGRCKGGRNGKVEGKCAAGGGSRCRRTSKLGRKGDPRMHRAVAMRLVNPEMTLLEALR